MTRWEVLGSRVLTSKLLSRRGIGAALPSLNRSHVCSSQGNLSSSTLPRKNKILSGWARISGLRPGNHANRGQSNQHIVFLFLSPGAVLCSSGNVMKPVLVEHPLHPVQCPLSGQSGLPSRRSTLQHQSPGLDSCLLIRIK